MHCSFALRNSVQTQVKMVSNYAIGMGLSFLTLVVAPAAAILNQRTNSTSVLQRSVQFCHGPKLDKSGFLGLFNVH